MPQPSACLGSRQSIPAAQRQGPHGRLAPYDNEEVVHPSSWSEQVYAPQPRDKGISTPADTTPLATPLPKIPLHLRGLGPKTAVSLTSSSFPSTAKTSSAAGPRAKNGSLWVTSARHAPFGISLRWLLLLGLPSQAEESEEADESQTRAPPKAKATRKRRGEGCQEGSGVESQPDSDLLGGCKFPGGPRLPGPDPGRSPSWREPSGVPHPESQPATAASSPEPEIDQVEVPDAEDNQPDAEEEVDAETVDSEPGQAGPVGPAFVTRYPKKQYAFRKLPDISAFEEALDNAEEVDDVTLYKTLEASAHALQAWQEEYNELKKIIDDEDNAKRRAERQGHRELGRATEIDDVSAWRRTFDEPLPEGSGGIRCQGCPARPSRTSMTQSWSANARWTR